MSSNGTSTSTSAPPLLKSVSMAYNAVAHDEADDNISDDETQQLACSASSPESRATRYQDHPGRLLTDKVQALIPGRNLPHAYDVVESQDYNDNGVLTRSPSPAPSLARNRPSGEIHRVHKRQTPHTANDAKLISTNGGQIAPLITPQPMRSASSRSANVARSSIDMQSEVAPYVTNVQHLEHTAEQLSMTSSIDDAIREMHDEQKRTDSRRSSILSSNFDTTSSPRISRATSAVDMNHAATTAAHRIVSPRQAYSGVSRRTTSKSSRGGRVEPDREGRPLEAFGISSLSYASSNASRSAAIAEDGELTPSFIRNATAIMYRFDQALPTIQDEMPRPRLSTDSRSQDQGVFEDFDGQHYAPSMDADSIRSREVSGATTITLAHNIDKCHSTSTLLLAEPPLARPQSYLDPSNGAQMVYYPAPVPMVLNLPQKLAKHSASTIAERRRTQLLGGLPAANRKSAVWLAGELDETEAQMPRGPDYMPPQLRANQFFEQQSIAPEIIIKNESATATLDSILEASAFAPVNAFTDHAFAGALGAEVYGADRRSRMNMRRTSTGFDTAQERRRSTMSSVLGLGKFARTKDMTDDDIEGQSLHHYVNTHASDPAAESESDPEFQGQFDDEIYHGPPTTLLAELQLRKQQQKARVRPARLVSGALAASGTYTTLLERELVATTVERNRKGKRVALAWEDPEELANDQVSSDDDVPLGVLYARKGNKLEELNRPKGLMETRDMEDNEPLARRRDRLQGIQQPSRLGARAVTIGAFPPVQPGHPALVASEEDEEETLGQQRRRMKAEQATREAGTGALNNDDLRNSSSSLSLNKTASAPALKARHSMADILAAHPTANTNTKRIISGGKVNIGGLLYLNDEAEQRRASTMQVISRDMASYRGETIGLQESRPGASGRSHDLVNSHSQVFTGVLGDYASQKAMMPLSYSTAPLQIQYLPNGLPQPAFGTYAQQPFGLGSQFGSGHHFTDAAAVNPVAASMAQLQMQMDQMAAMIAAQTGGVPQQRVEGVGRWRGGVGY